MKITANVKQVSVKTLVSSDRECRIVLSIVGAEVDNASELAKLTADKMVEVSWE